MTRVNAIIARVRKTLADPDRTRWSDEALLGLISEGQIDVARRCLLLKKTISLPLFLDEPWYSLSKDCIRAEKFEWRGKVLPYISAEVLDKRRHNWQEQKGVPEYVVFNNRNRLQFRLFPTPDKVIRQSMLTLDSDLFGVISQDSEGIRVGQRDGAIVDIQGGTGVISDEAYGVVTDILEVDNEIKVYYHARPERLTSLEQELELSEEADTAIYHYTVAHALRDDKDTQSRAMANEELAFYMDACNMLHHDSETDFVKNNNYQLEVEYSGGL